MKNNIAILAPGKGWGNFVSYISCFKKISEVRKKKIILITKKFSSAPSYLSDQNFVDKFIEIPDNNRGFLNKIKSIIYIFKELKKSNLNEIFIFHSSSLYVLICYIVGIKNIYAPGIKNQNFLLKKENKLYENNKSKLIDPVEESKALTKKILNSDEVSFSTLNYINKIDDNKIAVCIACSGKEKQWGEENYVKLINFLISKKYRNFLIIAGKDQEKLENKITNTFDENLNFIKTSSKSIGEVLPDLKQCKLFIGNDTGFFHLAVALGKKSFVILGDCPPHTYSDLIINIDCEITRSHDSIKSIDCQKVINVFNKYEN